MNNHFVSKEGLEALKSELEHREKVVRREIAEKISVAKDQGDLSENFEYQESKDQQAQNETRIIELRDIISRVTVVDAPTSSDKITLGSEFKVEAQNGEVKEFKLVGSTEADPMSGKISNDSPLGNAFLGQKKDDIITVNTPAGEIKYKIISII
jgi:transcription elongation factor GreA